MLQFNAKNICNRNIEQIRIKYDNLKCKARKVSAANKMYMRGTGGGPAGDSNIDPVIEAVLRIVNKTTVIGLQNPFDCDYSSVKGDDNNVNTRQEANNIIILGSENLSSPRLKQDPVVLLDPTWTNDDLIDLEYVCTDNSKGNETLEPVEHTQVTETPALNPLKTDKKSESGVNENSWSKYTPKQLKLPMSKKLRQTIKNPIKDDYYKKKIQLIGEEIKRSRLQQEEIIEKREHALEEHNKKMQLLEYEIELKKNMLNEK